MSDVEELSEEEIQAFANQRGWEKIEWESSDEKVDYVCGQYDLVVFFRSPVWSGKKFVYAYELRYGAEEKVIISVRAKRNLEKLLKVALKTLGLPKIPSEIESKWKYESGDDQTYTVLRLGRHELHLHYRLRPYFDATDIEYLSYSLYYDNRRVIKDDDFNNIETQCEKRNWPSLW
ncbi:MAG: hypothetical protein HA495_00395 [Thaumarchaeota archaeon]|nr:hypothetical protein [Nitrososphaerota archaeon]